LPRRGQTNVVTAHLNFAEPLRVSDAVMWTFMIKGVTEGYPA
jgi:hypothetical protein